MLLWAATVTHAAAQDRPPNVLFILCDDLRWDSVGCAGHPHIRTPHIDRLAREGVHFMNTFCTTSLCSPSRASILTGLYAHSHGVRDNFTELPAGLPHWAGRLHESGYQTAYFGKWHMGEDNDQPRVGFDTFVSHKGQGKYFGTEWSFGGGRREVNPGYYTTVVTQMALEWLNTPSRTEKPWALCLGHKAPHSFYTPEEQYAHRFDDVQVKYPPSAFELDDKPSWIRERRSTWHGIYGPLFEWRKNFPDERPEAVRDFQAMVRAYWSTILSVDDSVGALLNHLEHTGELERTIVVFMGDNGLLEGENGMVDKRTMHEPSIRVPLLVRYPNLGAGRRVQQQVLSIDLAPSILELCGARPLAGIHGKSWVNLARKGDPAWRRDWFYEYNYERQFPYTPNVRGIRTDRWKYIHYPHGDGSPDRHIAELYDLASDPQERRNLIDTPAAAGVLPALKTRLGELMTASGLNPADDRMPLDEGVKKELPDQKIR